MKENLESISQSINEVENIKFIFLKQIELEKLPLYKDILQSIFDHFEKAKNSDDQVVIQESLKWIEIHKNYLSEKYRDTIEERDYIKTVRTAIAFLREKLNLHFS